ncbi:hypothetical protein EVAR_9880_1 [Eumeta japonica]|uniref:Uncharacterized protein n=1 Tax=Eumeta variegata TaxID=151549 RepID=A0A4C1TQ97_EUMVA|nr:hypothetical protein EVAR_9880_1 [Eumeta japonica]
MSQHRMEDDNLEIGIRKDSCQECSKELPCPWLCNRIPANVPSPDQAQKILHPKKDVFVLKVSKVNAYGDKRCKMELELLTPPMPPTKPPARLETRETQFEPNPPPCPCSCLRKKKRKRKLA